MIHFNDADQIVQITTVPAHAGRVKERYLPMSDRLLIDFAAYPVGSDPAHPSTIYGILEDLRGQLWVSSNDGLVRLNPAGDGMRRQPRSVSLSASNGGGTTHDVHGPPEALTVTVPSSMCPNPSAPRPRKLTPFLS